MGGFICYHCWYVYGKLGSCIVVVGLPTILQSLHASIVHGIWIITGYTLMMTILAVILGRLADLYGRVKLYNLGFAIFTVGSLLCALSQTGEQLIIFRFLQGSGAALLMVNSAAIITDAFPKGELGSGTWNKHDGCEPGEYCRLYSQWCDDYVFWMEVNIPT